MRSAETPVYTEYIERELRDLIDLCVVPSVTFELLLHLLLWATDADSCCGLR